MIRTRNLVPEVYYNESRDFQTIGRTFEILINYLKTNVDLIKELPYSKNSDEHMLPLMATTLGFTNKRNYNTNELRILCSSFSELLRKKGSKESVIMAVTLMLHAHHINEPAKVVEDPNDRFNYLIYIPYELKDTTMLEDIFDYILPCGFTYNFIYASVGMTFEDATSIGVEDKYAYRFYGNNISNPQISKIATPDSVAKSPSMPSSGVQIPEEELTLISSTTTLKPDDGESEE